MTPEQNARGVVNGLLYIAQFDQQLNDAAVERIAEQLQARPLFGQPVSDTVEAVRVALASAEDVTGHVPQPHDEATCRAFLAKLVQRLVIA